MLNNPMRALFVFDTGEATGGVVIPTQPYVKGEFEKKFVEAWNRLGGKHRLKEIRIL